MKIGELYQDKDGDFRTHTAEDEAQLQWNQILLLAEWGAKD